MMEEAEDGHTHRGYTPAFCPYMSNSSSQTGCSSGSFAIYCPLQSTGINIDNGTDLSFTRNVADIGDLPLQLLDHLSPSEGRSPPTVVRVQVRTLGRGERSEISELLPGENTERTAPVIASHIRIMPLPLLVTTKRIYKPPQSSGSSTSSPYPR